MTRPTDDRPDLWAEVTAARLPADALGALAAVRGRAGVRVRLVGDLAWVTWPAGAADVVRCLRPARGVAFFAERDGAWFRLGRRVPTADRPPDDPGQPLDAVLVPGRVSPTLPAAGRLAPVRVGVVRGGPVRPATALRCRLADLLPWAESATTAELAAVTAARCGEVALLRGEKLPTVRDAVRFWGANLLVPLGYRVEPDLPPEAVRAAAGAAADELLVLDEAGAEAVPEAAFAPLTRAGVRLAGASP